MAKKDTNEKIELAAIRLFADNGYHRTSIKRIAEEAKVSELTVFRNYGTKDELFLQCFVRQVPEKWLKELRPNPKDSTEQQILTLCEATYKTLIERIDLIRIVQRDATEHPEILQRAKDAPRRIWGPISEYLRQIRPGLKSDSADIVAFQLWAAYFGIATMLASIGDEPIPFSPELLHSSFAKTYSLLLQ